MSRKEETRIFSDEVTQEPLEVVYLRERRPDGSTRIGNSHECPRADAIEMIKGGLAKHASAVIGELPEGW